MIDERFRAPRVEVADLAAEPPGPPPTPVRAACMLNGIAVLLGLVSMSLHDMPSGPDVPAAIVSITYALVLALSLVLVWLTVMIWRRRNWARWALLVLMALGWMAFLADLGDRSAQADLAFMLDGASMGIELVGAALVFFGAGGRWFRREPPRR